MSFADVAQLAVHMFCKYVVVGSTPTVGFSGRVLDGLSNGLISRHTLVQLQAVLISFRSFSQSFSAACHSILAKPCLPFLAFQPVRHPCP